MQKSFTAADGLELPAIGFGTYQLTGVRGREALTRAIQNGYAVEASLGYYIFPIVAVVLGMLAFGERLNGPQVLAVVLTEAASLPLA